jgi:hypothetical protein
VVAAAGAASGVAAAIGVSLAIEAAGGAASVAVGAGATGSAGAGAFSLQAIKASAQEAASRVILVFMGDPFGGVRGET